VRIKELLRTIEERKDVLKEIIVALSLNPQGEHTDTYIRETLSPLQKKYNFSIVSLGRGLSTGTELEYSDSETIKNALKNRA
jgi:recombinational DNA repair protein RecR